MTVKSNIDLLEEEIERQKEKIKNSFPLDNNQIPIIDLVRCLDHSYMYVQHILPRDHDDFEDAALTDQFISQGFNVSLSLFLDDSIYRSGYPLFKSSKEEIQWTNNTILIAGHIGYLEQFITLSKQGLYEIKKQGDKFKFLLTKTTKYGQESLSNKDWFWWRSQQRISEEDEIRFFLLKPIIKKQLVESVDIWKDHFIQYTCTEELDEFYDILGKFYSRRYASSDAFPIDAVFGDFTFGEIMMIIEALIGYRLKHKDHCIELLNKTKFSITPWNIYSLHYRMDDVAMSISIHKELNYEKVLRFIEEFSVDTNNIKELCSVPGNAPPPLIRISREMVLESIAGSLINPFSYVLNFLKVHYKNDYFKAVNGREDIFKKELYELLKSENLILVDRNVKLKKSGKELTDIDAVIYDKVSQTAVLVQLKWMDDFGNSMKMRKSMGDNFYSSCVKWIDKLEEWTIENNISKVVPELGEVKNIELLILGRNFSHFSDQTEDSRAIWSSWYRLYRIITESPDLKEDLGLLITTLKENSVQTEDIGEVESIDLKVGKYIIEITA